MGPVVASVIDGWTVPPSKAVAESVVKQDVFVDGVACGVRVFYKNNKNLFAGLFSKEDLPTLVYFHGGGFATWSFKDSVFDQYLTHLAALDTCVIVAIDYTSAADKPFPAGLDDCVAATKAAIAGKVPHISKGKVCIAGDSSGGNLAVARAPKAKTENWIKDIAGLYTLCPYFDGETKNAKYPSMMEFDGYFGSKGFLNAVVNDVVKDEDRQAWSKNPLLWPIHATADQLKGLPPTKTVVMELDMISDTGVAFNCELKKAGVDAVSLLTMVALESYSESSKVYTNVLSHFSFRFCADSHCHHIQTLSIVSGGVHEQQLFTAHSPEATDASIHDLAQFVTYASECTSTAK